MCCVCDASRALTRCRPPFLFHSRSATRCHAALLHRGARRNERTAAALCQVLHFASLEWARQLLRSAQNAQSLCAMASLPGALFCLPRVGADRARPLLLPPHASADEPHAAARGGVCVGRGRFRSIWRGVYRATSSHHEGVTVVYGSRRATVVCMWLFGSRDGIMACVRIDSAPSSPRMSHRSRCVCVASFARDTPLRRRALGLARDALLPGGI